MSRRGLNVFYEFKYFGKGWSIKDEQCDITASPAFYPFEGTHKEEFLWVEAKFTGLKELQWGMRGWKYDFSKLKSVDNRIRHSTNHCYWVWLYLFRVGWQWNPMGSNYGKRRSWTDPVTRIRFLKDIALLYSPIGQTLTEISQSSPMGCLFSVIPVIKDEAQIGDSSALLVSAKLK